MLDGSASSDNVAIRYYSWSFMDGTAKTLSGVKQTYVFTVPGTYTITLNITDAAGNWAIDTTMIRAFGLVLNIPSENVDLNVQYDMSVSYLGGEGPSGLGFLLVAPSGKQLTYPMTSSIIFDEPGEWVCFVLVDQQILLEKNITVQTNLVNDLIRQNILQRGILIAVISAVIVIFLKQKRKHKGADSVEWPEWPELPSVKFTHNPMER